MSRYLERCDRLLGCNELHYREKSEAYVRTSFYFHGLRLPGWTENSRLKCSWQRQAPFLVPGSRQPPRRVQTIPSLVIRPCCLRGRESTGHRLVRPCIRSLSRCPLFLGFSLCRLLVP